MRPSFEQALAGVPLAKIGEVTDDDRLTIRLPAAKPIGRCGHLTTLKEAWQAPLRW